MTNYNPYQAYTDGSVMSGNPLHLIVALYQGAIEGTQQAEQALRNRDIMGRSKAINKVLAILSELLVSLDRKRGGEISDNLASLYLYMQTQLTTAHSKQMIEPIQEVGKLLTTLLEGWRVAVKTPSSPAVADPGFRPAPFETPAMSGAFYACYQDDFSAGASLSDTAYSF